MKLKYFSGEHVQYMVDAYAAGESTQFIASTLGVHANTVAKYLKDAGIVLRPPGFRSGEDHHAWKGGRTINEDGYALVRIYPDDPNFCMAQEKVKGASYVYEHRLVMARHLGRPLADTETVHHIDGNKQNNDISNLQLRHGRHGKGSAFQCADCGSHNIVTVPLKEPN